MTYSLESFSNLTRLGNENLIWKKIYRISRFKPFLEKGALRLYFLVHILNKTSETQENIFLNFLFIYS